MIKLQSSFDFIDTEANDKDQQPASRLIDNTKKWLKNSLVLQIYNYELEFRIMVFVCVRMFDDMVTGGGNSMTSVTGMAGVTGMTGSLAVKSTCVK